MTHLWAWAVLLLLLLQLQPGLQQCDTSDVKARGAKGNGVQDDDNYFLAVEADATAGVIYMPPGTYKIGHSTTITKPVIAAAGAQFLLPSADITLTLVNQPQHPLDKPLFTGPGKVIFAAGTQFVVPEWFGAVANGAADDSAAIQAAYGAAKQTGNAMLYLAGTYGIGTAVELRFKPGGMIMADTKASFVAVNGQTKGITFTNGNWGTKSVLPHLYGFSDFCAQLQGVSLGAFQFRNLTNCGDAIRIQSTGPGMHCLDNTVWFEKIRNSRVGVAVRAEHAGCVYGNCIFQGNQVVGNSIEGGASTGASYAILMNSLANPSPAWDSNNFDLLTISPPNNPAYRVFSAAPNAAREILKIASLGALPHPDSRVFGKNKLDMMQIQIRHSAPLLEHQYGLWGELNLSELFGTLTPAQASSPVRMVNNANSKAQFNGGKSIHGTYNTLQAVPNSDWLNGEVRPYYMYHQQANNFLYQIKCSAPQAANGMNQVDCVQYNDNSYAVPNEVVIWLINQSNGTIKAGTPATFTIAINTLGQP